MPQEFMRSIHAREEGVALAHTIYGEPSAQGNYAAFGSAGPNGNIQRATFSVFEAYKSPDQKLTETIHTSRRCLGKDGTCKGFPMKDLDYCSGHARSLGLVPNWNKNGKMTDDGPPDAA